MRHCPACRQPVVGFFAYGIPDWGCPECGASPRERLVNLCLDTAALSLRAKARVLHLAPSEKSLVARFRAAGDVVFGDLEPSRYDVCDIQRVDLMDMSHLGAFDLIYASHVMEHVPNDGRAFQNMYSQLRPGGQVWILVPMHDASTDEGHAGMTPLERERRFGQWDHVRQYGPDLLDRMCAVGFHVTVVGIEHVPAEEQYRCGLWPGDRIFVGTCV